MLLSRSKLANHPGNKKERQIDALAGAICRFLAWREDQMTIREERKLKAMLTRLRNRKRSSPQ